MAEEKRKPGRPPKEKTEEVSPKKVNKDYNPNIVVARVRKIGVDEVTGEPLFKPFSWTGTPRDYQKLLNYGNIRKSASGNLTAVFQGLTIIEEEFLPEGCMSVTDWIKAQEAKK